MSKTTSKKPRKFVKLAVDGDFTQVTLPAGTPVTVAGVGGKLQTRARLRLHMADAGRVISTLQGGVTAPERPNGPNNADERQRAAPD